jgi:hypothetical protein
MRGGTFTRGTAGVKHSTGRDVGSQLIPTAGLLDNPNMLVSEAQACYREFSGKASDLVRQLSFAGLAIIWIFHVDHAGATAKLPIALLWPGLTIVAALLLDFSQYAYCSAAWGFLARHLEKHNGPTHEFKLRREMNWPSIVCFWGKIIALVAAYVLLFIYVARQLF